MANASGVMLICCIGPIYIYIYKERIYNISQGSLYGHSGNQHFHISIAKEPPSLPFERTPKVRSQWHPADVNVAIDSGAVDASNAGPARLRLAGGVNVGGGPGLEDVAAIGVWLKSQRNPVIYQTGYIFYVRIPPKTQHDIDLREETPRRAP